jgi:hypothetical protein
VCSKKTPRIGRVFAGNSDWFQVSFGRDFVAQSTASTI